MKINLSVLAVVLLQLAIGGCVSTTTGTTRTPTNDLDSAEQNYQLGARYYRNGSYDLARDRLERALEFDPKLGKAHTTLALTYIKLENMRLATHHYERAVRVDPDNYSVRNDYAVFLCQRGEYNEAQKQFDRAAAEIENDYKELAYTNAGVCMSNRPDYDLAEEYFRKAISYKPSYSEPLLQMAVLKHRTENDLTARGFLQRFRAVGQDDPQVLYLCVQIEKSLGDERAAGECTNALLRDYPNSAEAQYLLQQNR